MKHSLSLVMKFTQSQNPNVGEANKFFNANKTKLIEGTVRYGTDTVYRTQDSIVSKREGFCYSHVDVEREPSHYYFDIPNLHTYSEIHSTTKYLLTYVRHKINLHSI